MNKDIYVVIECSRCIGGSIVSKCMRAFENEEDANEYYFALVGKNKDVCGMWFEIQKCELEVADD